jgi:hypothetical protein
MPNFSILSLSATCRVALGTSLSLPWLQLPLGKMHTGGRCERVRASTSTNVDRGPGRTNRGSRLQSGLQTEVSPVTGRPRHTARAKSPCPMAEIQTLKPSPSSPSEIGTLSGLLKEFPKIKLRVKKIKPLCFCH